jgi:hypothetical protein
MKKYIKPIFITFVIIAGLTIAHVSFAQPPAPPASGSNGGASTPMGGTAPIDGGLSILLAAGAIYGGKKIYQAKFSQKETK